MNPCNVRDYINPDKKVIFRETSTDKAVWHGYVKEITEENKYNFMSGATCQVDLIDPHGSWVWDEELDDWWYADIEIFFHYDDEPVYLALSKRTKERKFPSGACDSELRKGLEKLGLKYLED